MRRGAGQLWNKIEEAEHEILSGAGIVDSQEPHAALVAEMAKLDLTKLRRRQESAKIKSKIIAAIAHVCEACGEDMGSPDLVHLHHIVPIARGGTNHRPNLILLCPNDHARAHKLDRSLPEGDRPCSRADLIRLLSQR